MTAAERITALETRLAQAETRLASLERVHPAVPDKGESDDLPPAVQMMLLQESRGLSPESVRTMTRAVRLKYAMAPGSEDEKSAVAMQYISKGETDVVRAFVDMS